MSQPSNSLMEAAGGGMPIREMAAALRHGDFTARQLAAATLENIERVNPRVHAFVAVAPQALADAERADSELSAGADRGPFHGIPVALKDVYDVAGMATTCQSLHRLDHLAESDSAVTARLRARGAVIIGKVATYEFAFGDPQGDQPFPAARNPWRLDRDPGGSSSGSGAAVAAGLVRVAFGTDTGGSIRCPAGWCGVVGLKPTANSISDAGVFPLSPSLDTCGPLAKSIDDASLAFWAVRNSEIATEEIDIIGSHRGQDAVPADVKGMRIGVATNYLDDHALNSESREAILAAIEILRGRGAIISHVLLPEYSTFSACAHLILLSEAFALHRDLIASDFRKYGTTLRQRLPIGAFIDDRDVANAHRLRGLLTDKVDSIFENQDALITTNALGTAGPRYAPDGVIPGEWPMRTIPYNLTGHPALAVPTGLASDGLPLSLQIVGRHCDEWTTLRVGRTLEQVLGFDRWHSPSSQFERA